MKTRSLCVLVRTLRFGEKAKSLRFHKVSAFSRKRCISVKTRSLCVFYKVSAFTRRLCVLIKCCVLVKTQSFCVFTKSLRFREVSAFSRSLYVFAKFLRFGDNAKYLFCWKGQVCVFAKSIRFRENAKYAFCWKGQVCVFGLSPLVPVCVFSDKLT